MPVLSPTELERILADVVARLRAALSPQTIYLYGSYAYGTPKSHSDLDLLVVLSEDGRSSFQRDATAIRALGDLRFPIDVLVYTRLEFEERAALRVSFERTIKRKGRVLHAA